MIHILIEVITQIGRLLAQKLLHVYSQGAVGHALNSCHIRDDKHSILSPVLSCVGFAVVHQNFLSR